jgi:hypothetical protein
MNLIETLEKRVTELKGQLELFSGMNITQEQRDAVSLGHSTIIKEIEERIACLRAGKPDPFA